MPSLHLLVVLYKTSEKKSLTLVSLLSICTKLNLLINSHLTIWNNAYEFGLNDEKIMFPNFFSVKRIKSRNNEHLSVIYNKCTSKCKKFDAFCILDQDTILTESYFRELFVSINREKEIQCFVPLVYAKNNERLVSPGKLHLIKGKYWKKIKSGKIPSRNLLAIASGMVIRSSYLSDHTAPFDTRLNLYGIDTKFMIDYAKNNPFVYVLKVSLQHGHSSSEDEPVDMKIYRFLNWKCAWRIINSESYLKRWLYEIYAFYRSVLTAIRFRHLGFLRLGARTRHTDDLFNNF